MSKLGVVEDTLFVPMLGRIYASEYCPQILYDPKALELKKKLPSSLPEQDGQSQYTLLASAARSANMDRYIRAFLERRPDGVIVQLGCGLETAYYRCDNGRSRWYAVDLPHVVEYRRELLPEPERETYLAGDAFAEDWIRQIRTDAPDAPILVTAGGLFHYFEESKVVGLLRMLTGFGEIEIVFDSVSKSGMAMMRKKYMKQVGHGDAQMFFYRYIRTFLEHRPDGVIVQLGCGLETAYYRCDNGRLHWYAVDLPHVVEYRRELLPEPERETYLAGDAFAEDWIRQIRTDAPDAPILVTAGGLFHYFEESKVVGLLRMLTGFGEIEIVFDTVSKSGMAMMRKKYMKQVGHGDAQMFFYVDSASVLAGKTGSGVRVLAEEPYYRPC